MFRRLCLMQRLGLYAICMVDSKETNTLKTAKQMTTKLITNHKVVNMRKSTFCLNKIRTNVSTHRPTPVPSDTPQTKEHCHSPDPRHISDRWQSVSPGSLHKSTTSRHSVSGVTGTSVKCWSLLLRYTVRNIWNSRREKQITQ